MTQDEHSQAIRAWRGSDTKPIPEPCEISTCPFCRNWFGVEIGQPRIAVWLRRNDERGTPVTGGKVAFLDRLAG
ncbi:MAG: hypothetical protein KDJ70_11785 [Candidatus Competibacteraceae bacterium]|nr:hypothetical protein [Candidatus Competibacteraceae bacterium]